MRIRRAFFLVAIAWVLSTSAGCHRESTAADHGDGERPPVPVQTVKATRTTLRPSIELIGTVVADPERVAVLPARISAPVRDLLVLEGHHVSRADVVIQLSAEKVAAELAKAEATLAENQAALQRLAAGAREQELEVARKTCERAHLAVATAREKFEAIQGLHRRKEASDRQLADAERALQTSEADEAAAQAQLKLLELGPRKEAVAEAEAHVAVAQADVEAAKLQCEWAEIKSPINGELVELKARKGMQADPGAALATVVDLTEVHIQTRLPAARFAEVSPDATVEIHCDAMPHQVFAGKVFRLGHQSDVQTGDIPVWISVPNPDHKLRLGLVVHATLYTGDLSDAIVIPERAIAEQDGAIVTTIIEGGKTKTAQLKLGARAAGMVQVLEGLRDGDEVAIEGGYGLPPGTSVVVQANDTRRGGHDENHL
jgi:multidrug efflux pump subunit AcrA (membrane-fusion protein)